MIVSTIVMLINTIKAVCIETVVKKVSGIATPVLLYLPPYNLPGIAPAKGKILRDENLAWSGRDANPGDPFACTRFKYTAIIKVTRINARVTPVFFWGQVVRAAFFWLLFCSCRQKSHSPKAK